MNNAELEKLLKAVRVPERTPDYWEQFPTRVNTALHWQSKRAAANTVATRHWGVTLAAWGAGFAAACVILGFAVVFWKGRAARITSAQLAVAQEYYRELAALFPNQLEAIIIDDRGPRVVLAEQPGLPNVAPIYLRVCGPQGCRVIITFSGQQVRVNDDTCDVLLDAAGNVLLVGRKVVWSSEAAKSAADGYRIAARTLSTT